MAVKWADVESKPEFQSLSDEEKFSAQNQFFEENLASQIPEEDRSMARSQFLGEYGRGTVDTGQSRAMAGLSRVGRGLAETIPSTLGGIGELSEGYVRNLNPVGLAARMGIPGAQSLVDIAAKPGAFLRETVTPPIQTAVERATPINPLFERAPEQEALGVVGQAGGQLASMLIPAKALSLTPKVAQALGLTQAAAMGASAGGEAADQYGVTDPTQRSLMALLYGGAEAGTEAFTGFGSGKGTRQLLGDMRSFLTGKGAGERFLKTAIGEGLEEVPAGVAQDTIANVIAEDPNRPGFSLSGIPLPNPLDPEARLKEFGYGTLAGGLFGAGQLAGSRSTVEEALQHRKRAQEQIKSLEGQELSASEKAELDQLKEQDQNISQWLTLQGARKSIPVLEEIAPDDPEVRDFKDLVDAADIVQDSDMDLGEKERLLRSYTQEILSHPANQINPFSQESQSRILNPVTPQQSMTQQVKAQAEASNAPMTASVLGEVSSEQPTAPQTDAVQIASSTSLGTYPSGNQSLGRQESGQGMGLLDQGQETPRTEEVNAPPTKVQEQSEMEKQGAVSQAAAKASVPDSSPQPKYRIRRLPGQLNTEPISREDASAALSSYLEANPERRPFVQNAWIGTTEELANNEDIKGAFIQSLGDVAPEQGEQAWEEWLMSPREGFQYGGRPFVVLDRVVVNRKDLERGLKYGMKPEQFAVRRLLAHEDRHVLTNFVAAHPDLTEKFDRLANQIPVEDLDSLARRRYHQYDDWRENREHARALQFEWFSEQAESEFPENPNLIQQFLDWLRDAYARLMGIQPQDVTDQEMRDFLRRASQMQAEVAQTEMGGIQESIQPSQPEIPQRPAVKLPNYTPPGPTGNTLEEVLDYMWPQFYTAWESRQEDAGLPLDEAALKQAWQEEVSDPDYLFNKDWDLRTEKRNQNYDWVGYQPPVRDLTAPETEQIQESQPEFYRESPETQAQIDQDIKDLPEPMKNFAQVLGQRTDKQYLVQQVKPMVDFARSKINAGLPEFFEDGEKTDYSNTDRPPVTEENTKKVFQLATALLDKQNPYALEYNQEIQRALGTSYDAAAEVLKLELMDYAVRLASTYKPGEEYKLELPLMLVDMANDTVTGLYATVSGAGRLLNVRGRANKGGFWDAMKLIKRARDQAAASKVGERGFQALTDSQVSSDADIELIQGLNDSTAYDAVQELVAAADAKLQAQAEEEQDNRDWWEKGLEAVGEWERGMLLKIQDKVQRIVAIKELLAQLPPEVTDPFQASLPPELESIKTDRNALLRELAALEKGLTEDLKAIEKVESKLTEPQRKKVAKKIRAAITPQSEAEAILKRYEKKPKAAKKEASPLKKLFLEQIKNPKSVEQFTADAIGFGVDEATAKALYQTASMVRSRRDQAKLERRTDPERAANSERFVNKLVEQILNAPLSLQTNPAWRRQTFIDAFLSRGLSQDQAEAAADTLNTVLAQQWKKAKVHAAQKAAKRLGIKGLPMEAIIKAINSEAFSSTDPITKALAEQAGFKELPKAKIARMAWLAEQVQNPSNTPTEAAVWRSELESIVESTQMPKGFLEVFTRSFENSALSGTSNFGVNYLSTPFTLARRALVDLLGIVGSKDKGKLTQAANNILSLKDAVTKRFANEVKNSWKNDAYSRRQIDYLNKSYSLRQEIRKNLDIWNSPTASGSEKAKAAVKIVYSSTDLVRRILSVADQAWGATMEQYFFRTEGMRELLNKQGMSPKEARLVTEMAVTQAVDRTNARTQELAAQGQNLDPSTVSLIQQDCYNQAIREYLNLKEEGSGEKVAETADKEAAAEIGAIPSETPALWDVPQWMFEGVKAGSQAVLHKIPGPLGRMLVGFVSVPANVVNRSLYFTPWGLFRAWNKAKGANRDQLYNEMMATSQQQRNRVIEGIAGSIGIALAMALNGDDDDKDGFGVEITGQGPKNMALREAWLKRHRQNAVEITIGGRKFAVPWGRGGFEGVAVPFAAAGALSDMRLNRTDRKDATMVGRWIGQTAAAFFEQARFLGAKSYAEAMSKPSAVTATKTAAFTGSGMIPFSGFLKSLGRVASGQADQSSVESALKANVPVANFFSERKLNYLGDPTGRDEYVDRMWYAGLPFGTSEKGDVPNADIYELLIGKGYAPAFPSRSYIEGRNGMISDEKWASYIKRRGAIIKQEVRSNLSTLRSLPPREFDSELDRITSKATKTAKEQLNLD